MANFILWKGAWPATHDGDVRFLGKRTEKIGKLIAGNACDLVVGMARNLVCRGTREESAQECCSFGSASPKFLMQKGAGKQGVIACRAGS